jgi:hypothetical protein
MTVVLGVRDKLPIGNLWEGRFPFSNQVYHLVNEPAIQR